MAKWATQGCISVFFFLTWELNLNLRNLFYHLWCGKLAGDTIFITCFSNISDLTAKWIEISSISYHYDCKFLNTGQVGSAGMMDHYEARWRQTSHHRQHHQQRHQQMQSRKSRVEGKRSTTGLHVMLMQETELFSGCSVVPYSHT